MKLIKLSRPALEEPRRHLELQAREALGGLEDFVLAHASPSGWLDMELVQADTPAEPRQHPMRRTG